MDEDPRTGRSPVEDEPRDPEQIKREVEQAREDLGETVEALAAKADVKSRVKEKAEEQNPVPFAVAGAVVVVLVLVLVIKRRRSE